MREQVEKTIEVIRPALQADGGDIVLHDVDEATGVVTVELVGACVSCPASTVTLKAGIERIIRTGSTASPRSSTSPSSPTSRDAGGESAAPSCSTPPPPVTARPWPDCCRSIERGGERRPRGRPAGRAAGRTPTPSGSPARRAPASPR